MTVEFNAAWWRQAAAEARTATGVLQQAAGRLAPPTPSSSGQSPVDQLLARESARLRRGWGAKVEGRTRAVADLETRLSATADNYEQAETQATALARRIGW